METKVITPKEATEKAKKIVEKDFHDPEVSHQELDGLLCEVLESAGYGELVEVFRESAKWYA